jgi:TatD DNase family protein
MLVDSHCHLDFPEFSGRADEILAAMAANGVTHALTVSTNLPDFPNVLALAEGHDNIYASVGIHPDHAAGEEASVAQLVSLADHPKVVAIGETGLDYFRQQGDLEWQRQRFRTHIRAAQECGKPLIVHTRAAPEDTLRIMREEGARDVGGVMHCFTESLAVAEEAMSMNFHISFSGIVTFKNATMLKDVARIIPLSRMLIETDSPYLAPVPHRGEVNQPAYVRHVAEEIARLHSTTVEQIGRVTSLNFFSLFNRISFKA